MVFSINKACGLGLLLMAAFGPDLAKSQSITPMRQMVRSAQESFILKVNPANPYKHKIQIVTRVYDQDFKLIKARVVPRMMELSGGDRKTVIVEVPFNDALQRKIRICAESVPFAQAQTILRTRVCGKFFAQKIQ